MSTCVYILLPVHNRCEITRKFIVSLIQQTYDNYHLLLIDDGSTDGTDEMVQALISEDKLTIIKGSGDWWWAGSLQQGLHWLKKSTAKPSDIVLMINDDSVMKSDFLSVARTQVPKHPRSLMQASISCIETGEIVDAGVCFNERGLSFDTLKTYSGEVNCLTTNGLISQWKDLQVVGDFHPTLLPHYFSDYEFTIRAGKKGLDLMVSSELVLEWNRKTTGIRSYNNEGSFFSFLKTFFSKRSVGNPIYRTTFVLLICSYANMPKHIIRIWFNAVKQVLLYFIKR